MYASRTFFAPCFDRPASLPHIHLTAFTVHTVYTRKLEAQFVFHRSQHLNGLLHGDVHGLDVAFGVEPADLAGSRLLKRQCRCGGGSSCRLPPKIRALCHGRCSGKLRKNEMPGSVR
jgi:hypothetical protein